MRTCQCDEPGNKEEARPASQCPALFLDPSLSPRRSRDVTPLGLCNEYAPTGHHAAGPEVPMWCGRVLPPAKELRNWKMATEGGGRHSPSTVVWEEEGVPVIVIACRAEG